MKNNTKLKIVTVFAVFAVLSSCISDMGTDKVSFEKIKGNRYYGGTFRMNEVDEVSTLFPPKILDVISARIAYQIHEGLVKFEQSDIGNVVPAIAEGWSLDTSGTVYTFKLKKNVYFHDDDCFEGGKGRQVTAKDFKWTFELICEKENDFAFQTCLQDKVVGAEKLREERFNGNFSTGLEGVQVIDDFTLQIKLYKPYSTFLYMLAMPYMSVLAKEAFETYGQNITNGTGPFKYCKSEKGKYLKLVRNDNYYKVDDFGNKLPYLDTIHISFIPVKSDEVKAFDRGKLEMTYAISTEDIINIIEVDFNVDGKTRNYDYIQQGTPEMVVQYYDLLNMGSIFSNINVRKAFSYAINRELILAKVLQGAGYAPGIYGISPPIFKDYDVTKIGEYDYNKDLAQKYLSLAGYPDGKNFPKITLDLNAGGGRNVRVAEEVQRQLKKTLNVDLELNIISLKEKIEKSEVGQFTMLRAGWVADFPSPENFLTLLYGKNVTSNLDEPSYPNTSRYKNPKFDELYEKGLRAKTIAQGKQYFLEAEKLAMEDAPLIVLWYDENYRILQPYVKDFPNNPMQYRDFTSVWFDFEMMLDNEKEKDASQEEKTDK